MSRYYAKVYIDGLYYQTHGGSNRDNVKIIEKVMETNGSSITKTFVRNNLEEFKHHNTVYRNFDASEKDFDKIYDRIPHIVTICYCHHSRTNNTKHTDYAVVYEFFMNSLYGKYKVSTVCGEQYALQNINFIGKP
jgi:hypothetical protein